MMNTEADSSAPCKECLRSIVQRRNRGIFEHKMNCSLVNGDAVKVAAKRTNVCEESVPYRVTRRPCIDSDVVLLFHDRDDSRSKREITHPRRFPFASKITDQNKSFPL